MQLVAALGACHVTVVKGISIPIKSFLEVKYYSRRLKPPDPGGSDESLGEDKGNMVYMVWYGIYGMAWYGIYGMVWYIWYGIYGIYIYNHACGALHA